MWVVVHWESFLCVTSSCRAVQIWSVYSSGSWPECASPQGTSQNFQMGASPNALYNMDGFWPEKGCVQFTAGGLKQSTITQDTRGRENVKNHWSTTMEVRWSGQSISKPFVDKQQWDSHFVAIKCICCGR